MFGLSSGERVFPAHPSRFTASLIVSAGERAHDRLFREIEPRLPPEPAWIAQREGQLVVDEQVIGRTAYRWHVPPNWLAGPVADHGVRSRSRGSRQGLRLMIDRLRATRHALSDTRRVLQVTCRPYESFDAAIEAAQLLYVDFVVLSLRLRAARAIYESLARSAGIPDPVMRWLTFDAGHLMAQARLQLYATVRDDAAGTASLEAGRLPEGAAFAELWPVVLDRYGHRAADELDFAQPRYLEAPEHLIAALNKAHVPAHRSWPALRAQSAIAWRIPPGRWVRWSSRIQLEVRHRLMYAFAHLRFELLRLAGRAVQRGVLPVRDALWELSAEEVRMLDRRG